MPLAGKLGRQEPHGVHQRKIQSAPLRSSNPMLHYIFRAAQMESSSTEKDIGILVDTKLNMCQQ